jgi:hypothetical protein
VGVAERDWHGGGSGMGGMVGEPKPSLLDRREFVSRVSRVGERGKKNCSEVVDRRKSGGIKLRHHRYSTS